MANQGHVIEETVTNNLTPLYILENLSPRQVPCGALLVTFGFNFIVHFLGETGLRGFFQLVANDGEDAEDHTRKNHICLFFWTNISVIFAENWHHIVNNGISITPAQ